MRYKFDDIAINSIAKKKPIASDKNTYLGLEHLDSENLIVTRFGSDVAPIGEKLIMKKGDVLFGKRRAYQKKVAIAPFDGIFSAHGMVLRPKENVVDKDFFPLFINSDYFLDAAIKISVGSLSPTINWNTLKELEFELPPIVRQQQLSKILWAAIEVKNAYRMLLLLTKQIVKSRFVGMFGDPVTNPMGWQAAKLSEITSKIGSGATPRGGQENYIPNGISLIRSMNVYNGHFKYDELAHIPEEKARQLENVIVKEDDVLLNITGASIARSCIVPVEILPARVNQHVSIIRCESSRLNHIFANTLLISDSYQQFLLSLGESGGATRQAITKQQIENFTIFLPPITLQNRFAAFVRQADKSKFVVQQQTKNTSLLYNILNGG